LYQVNGQLMGSVLSFPILCLVNLVSQVLLHEIPLTRDALYAFVGCGINGDDLVTWGDETIGERWTQVLPEVGGVPSRGKTLFSQTYFTVNSELFTRKGMIRAIRPSLISALNTGAHKAPDRSWLEYMTSPYRSWKTDRIVNPKMSFFPSFPVSWGGTRGKRFANKEEFDYIGACFLEGLKKRGLDRQFEFTPSKPNIDKDGYRTLVHLAPSNGIKPEYDLVGGFMRKEDVTVIGKKVYGVKHAAFWTEKGCGAVDYDDALDACAQRYLGLTPYMKDLMWLEYCETWDHEEKGYVYVRSIADFGQEVIMPRNQGHFLTRSVVSRQVEDPYAWTY